MASATKTPAKRATSQIKSAQAPARAGSAAVRKASSKAVGVTAKNAAGVTGAAGAAKKTSVKNAVKRGLNGASAHTPAAKRAKASGVLSAELTGDVQELARVTVDGHDDEVVRKTRASANAGEAAAMGEVAVPVQIGGLTPEITRPAYWDKACADLVKRDRILKKLIPKFGPVHLLSCGDPFVTLARSVVGQQISVASAQAVWAKVEAACPKLVPQQFIKFGQEKLTACGLSRRKADYVLDLAQHFVSGALHVGKWTSMEDEAVIAELTQIRGIGRWTAEMFLIFNLSRPDVLPLDDLGLIRAISVNYFSGEPVTRSEAREVAANWEPWRTVATWYMWRSLDPLTVDY
ncbi:MAG: HhH-GPD base excision DNA repair family protein; Probable 3-methyladenine DNA glycosylase/8-oxoguanine DNA glycosylase [uncultured Paraburkholderia sp.]|nr:MAG: HhH-GPD base excision DNA repair family protein; Probable 3-methyladenine DNA glycosylase/8-oxoguanine DNA glycosylase [uncultured Paraburkholderia sp.]CAH2912808.1 MAG: HhH-GPD base excision DNA repair family protein; Probable 3-methyladenine DNA glycosylase/8-oxoguanine DNA glycosylase [uncultured Paraburkholderia sp.]